jgi:hypothetical protein
VPKLKLDHPGMKEMLLSAEVAAAIADVAETVASNVSEYARNGDAIPVDVSAYTSDRAAAAVTLAHPAGVGKEAKYGTLSAAAAAAGLEVTERMPE